MIGLKKMILEWKSFTKLAIANLLLLTSAFCCSWFFEPCKWLLLGTRPPLLMVVLLTVVEDLSAEVVWSLMLEVLRGLAGARALLIAPATSSAAAGPSAHKESSAPLVSKTRHCFFFQPLKLFLCIMLLWFLFVLLYISKKPDSHLQCQY